ncbi:MAG TPA: NfeD family protein [Stenomitos sp.]
MIGSDNKRNHDMTEVTWFWVGLGLALCLLELIFPTAFVELMMGLSAIVVAFMSLLIPSFGLQIFIWMLLSLAGVFGIRHFLPRKTAKILQAPDEGETLTAIAPDGRGRVQFEGSPWAARCADPSVAIAAGCKVWIVDREGTTLVVEPIPKLSTVASPNSTEALTPTDSRTVDPTTPQQPLEDNLTSPYTPGDESGNNRE